MRAIIAGILGVVSAFGLMYLCFFLMSFSDDIGPGAGIQFLILPPILALPLYHGFYILLKSKNSDLAQTPPKLERPINMGWLTLIIVVTFIIIYFGFKGSLHTIFPFFPSNV